MEKICIQLNTNQHKGPKNEINCGKRHNAHFILFGSDECLLFLRIVLSFLKQNFKDFKCNLSQKGRAFCNVFVVV